MSEAYRDLTIIQSNRTRLILQAASNKSIQSGFHNILADEGQQSNQLVSSEKPKVGCLMATL